MTASASVHVLGSGEAHTFRRAKQGPVAASRAEMRAVHMVDDAAEWDRLVAAHEAATPFHGSAWGRVLTETYGHQPLRLRFADGDRVSALLPIFEVRSPITGCRGVALPFSDLCPPLVFGNLDHETLVQQLTALAQERGWKHFELRGADALCEIVPAAVTFYGHELDLSAGVEQIEARYAANVHRNLRKAAKSSVVVEITPDEAALAQFYALLTRTRRRHGVPPQSWKFFRKVHQHLIAPGEAFLVMARLNGRAIAGALFLRLGGNAVYKYGASDERQQEFRANNLVMAGAIRHLVAAGARRLHFGRTARTNEGLRRFKLAWGAEERIIPYFRFDCSAGSWATTERDLAGRAGGIFRNLPLALNRLIGTMVYPHLD